jgi:hypothetical protein
MAVARKSLDFLDLRSFEHGQAVALTLTFLVSCVIVVAIAHLVMAVGTINMFGLDFRQGQDRTGRARRRRRG